MLTKAEGKDSYEYKKKGVIFLFFMHSAKGTNLIYHCDSKVIMIAAEASSEKSNQMNMAVLSFVNL